MVTASHLPADRNGLKFFTLQGGFSKAQIRTLIELANERGVAQIIIGRRGEGGLKQMMFGSVAANLVQGSSVPVTVVP